MTSHSLIHTNIHTPAGAAAMQGAAQRHDSPPPAQRLLPLLAPANPQFGSAQNKVKTQLMSFSGFS